MNVTEKQIHDVVANAVWRALLTPGFANEITGADPNGEISRVGVQRLDNLTLGIRVETRTGGTYYLCFEASGCPAPDVVVRRPA